MKRFLPLLMVLFSASAAWSLEKAQLETHIRKTLNIDPRIPISAKEPEPSDFGNLTVVPVTVGSGGFNVYISTDETRYIMGQVQSLGTDPDQARWSKINLSDVHAKGAPDAPITIVEYSDLECSFCRKAHLSVTRELYLHYSTAQVRVVMKAFPLSGHKWAERAAIAVECVAAQRRDLFWPMVDMVFTDAPTTTPENASTKLRNTALKFRIDPASFDACMEDPATLERVRAQKNEGIAVGVSSTPSFVVNGRVLVGYKDFTDLKTLVDDKMRELGITPEPAKGR